MPRPRSQIDLHLVSKVSTLYYLHEQTQQEIADRLHISRPRVSRLLQEAREQGIVQITVTPPVGLHLDLEARLEARFGLQEAEVVDVEPGNAEMLRLQIGAAAAGYLARIVQSGEAVGLSWGTTLEAMVRSMSPLPTDGVRVVQMLGGIGRPDAAEYAASLVRRLARLLGASPLVLPAPGVVGTPAVRDALRADPHVQPALEYLDSLDVAMVGLGSLRTNRVLTDGRSLPPGTHAELLDAGAVGDIALRFFDGDGTPVRTSLDERIIGITTDQLRGVKRVVAVAGGPDKVDAIFAGLRTGIIDVLITDQATAEAVAAHS